MYYWIREYFIGSQVSLFRATNRSDFKVGLFSKCKRIEISIIIEIEEVTIENEIIVDRTEWSKYGVIDVKK